jgi:hypothetical protein
MSWERIMVAPSRTHHVLGAEPLYAERYDEVLSFHAPGLAAVRRGAAAWHVGARGEAAYERRFSRTFGYYAGLAAVENESGAWHINTAGRDAYPTRHRWCGNFQEGRCTVRDADGSYFHIRSDGAQAYAARWKYAGDCRENAAVVQATDGRSTHIDCEGTMLHGRWFLDLDAFHKGFARARDDRGWTHVNRAGVPQYGRRFAAVEPFYNGRARVEREDGGLEVIDESGATVVELRPARRSDFGALSGNMVGYWRTRTIAAAVSLGIVDALPGGAGDVAVRCGLDLDCTARLLRALGELGLVERDGTRWHPTSAGAYLMRGHPLTLADAALEYAGPLGQRWNRLEDAIRGGRGWHASDPFVEVAGDAERSVTHHRMLASYASHDYMSVAESLELGCAQTVIDAGGGLGVLARMLVDHHPGLRVLVLDRPEVVAQVRERDAHDRITFRSADFFEPWTAAADAVVLARVLHDWDDEAAIRVLRNARSALTVGGRLFAIEMVLDEDGFAGGLCDLHLLVVTGGKERTATQFRKLFAAGGFDLVDVKHATALSSILVGVTR